ncbi:MAG: class I SAM-dependent methyltransferase [Solirubrobacteraceae bacterium]
MSGTTRHPLFARLYASGSSQESETQRACRRELLIGISGRVLELGAGDGRNFAFYPPGVEEVVAVEPEPYMRRRAQERSDSARVPLRVVDAVADTLPFADGSFDAAVVSLVLCSVPDQSRALAELRRVVRAGGELRFYEHVQADGCALRVFLTAMDRSAIYPRLAGGCHPARDTLSAIRAAGFDVVACRSFGLKLGALQPRIPHILGIARCPAG